ncbi:hypothetical protein PNEG_00660 [Pneumocystis murina B123]|uniref:Inner centromere protein ARK-binding domain-containing protein n=1 Tax=Pneumocystis murina (strain B123) TaxID=1069680 RepID=M7NQR2_PNEMU|nr:hypothetical protein PNEG_00660 [Pneumocystis murina B123]EMR11063.1 hypothetical protein PNEG_00660 [Pneumocystis murina B123]
MKPLINEIGSSSWVFQEVKYLSDLSNEKLNDFALKIVENLEWINQYMEDVVKNCESTFCDYSKSGFVCSEAPLVSEKGSYFVCQENFGKESLLLKSLSFKLIPSPLKDLKENEFMDISENMDINYDDILSESEDSSLSIMESNEQNINLKYDSSSTRVMEMITEEDEVDEEVLDSVEIKVLSRNDDLETKFPCVLKKDNIVSPEEKSFKSDIEKSVKFKKDYDIVLENKDAISPLHDSDSLHHLDSKIMSGLDTGCTSTSIIHSYFSPPIDNTVNKVSFSPPTLSSSLNFVSLPPREPLNTKKSLGKRVSRHGSFSETVKSQKIVDSKLYEMLKQENQEDSSVLENRLSEDLQKQHISEGISGKKMVFDEIDKHDISEQRLKTVFTSGSQRIHEALSSLLITKPTSGHFKLASVEQKQQPDIETKIFEPENNLIAFNKVSNTINNVSSGECLHETASQIENEEYWVSKVDILNRPVVNTLMKQEKELPFHDINEIKNEPDSDEGLTAPNKLKDTSQRRTSIITIPAISVIGAIQAARNSATQAIRKATSVFFSPSSKAFPRNSIENAVERPLKVLNSSYDENTCLDSKRISDLKVNLEENNELSKNTTYKVEVEQPSNIIETKHNSIKACDYGQETNINKTRFLAKKSSALTSSISHEEVSLMANKFVSQELSCQNLKIQPSQPVKLTSFNSVSIAKNKPVSIRVTTASQRQADLAEKRKVQKTDFATSLQQSFASQTSQNQDNCSVTDSMQFNDSCSRELSVLSQSRSAKRLIPSKGIKALTAANLARKREQEEKDRKLAHKKEIERKRQENLKKQEENKKQEQWHREDLQRKVHSEKINDTKKKLLPQRLEHSSSVAKKICTISSDNNERGPLEDIINSDGKNRNTLNMEAKTFKRVLQDDLVQENWNSFSVSNKSLFQEVKKRKTDDISNESISNMPIHISSVKKDDKDPFVLRTQTREKGSCLNIQAMPQKHTRLLQSRYQGNQQISSSKSGKITGPIVDTVKFSTDNIRFGGESSKTVPVSHQYPQSESIELPEIDSDYSDDDELKKRFKTTLPQWAESPELTQILRMQAKIDPDKIFGPMKPLQMEEIFRGKDRAHMRFRSRSSSANWSGQDRLTEQEIENYAKIMGYKT